jgi:alanyl-tRNA synthetase
LQSLGLNEIREKFLLFFESKEHLRLPSYPLVPRNDKSLLLINSGMAPLKPYFTGQETPPSPRVTTCQKCIRTIDIDNVGKTDRHGTFFEMLGDFSFGDYFKEEVIPWSWEFLTRVLEIPEEKLYISVYEDDDEAFKIWNEKIGIAADRIYRMGKDDNFWEVGVGPCGPCSEIYYDRGERYGCGKPDCAPGCDCDRFMEVWNLVFTQFNKEEDGGYSRLPKPNIDTGMGLERISMVMQDAGSMFELDTVRAIIDRVCALSGRKYNIARKDDISIRIIVDHVRSITFMTGDGILPSNEGRGYVLRRLLRRAARHGKLLGIDKPFLAEMSDVVINVSSGAYPELSEKREFIFKVLSMEERRFYETLEQGLEMLRGSIAGLKARGCAALGGETAFRLYDTYGFPLELMKEILSEEGLEVEEDAFNREMERQRARARAAREESTFMGADETVYDRLDDSTGPSGSTGPAGRIGPAEFTGYDRLDCADAKIVALVLHAEHNEVAAAAGSGAAVSVILDKTSFYAESGGQKGDTGVIRTETGLVGVTDCIKITGGRTAHIGKVAEGEIFVGQNAVSEVDRKRRLSTTRSHSATHLLQKALRDTLGSHVEQAGSLVSPDRLRFDFTHFSPLTARELHTVESLVNEKILEDLPVTITETSMEEARGKGAMALFGEKYSDLVRVVDMSGYSVELCGGTHVTNTSRIGTFRIISESGVAAGVRRVEALTGFGALEYYDTLRAAVNEASEILKTSPDYVIKKIQSVLNESKELARLAESLKAKLAGGAVDSLINSGERIGGVNVRAADLGQMDMNGLRAACDKVRDALKSGAAALCGVADGKLCMVVMATEDIVKRGVNAGQVVKEAMAEAGGSGGGRPGMAQAGGGRPEAAGAALAKARAVIARQLGDGQ